MKTWLDKILLFLFAAVAVLVALGIYLCVDKWIAYGTLILTIIAVMASVIAVRPHFLNNAMSLKISQPQIPVILRVASIILLLVVITLQLVEVTKLISIHQTVMTKPQTVDLSLFSNDPQHNRYNSDEHTLSSQNVEHLTLFWSRKPGEGIYTTRDHLT